MANTKVSALLLVALLALSTFGAIPAHAARELQSTSSSGAGSTSSCSQASAGAGLGGTATAYSKNSATIIAAAASSCASAASAAFGSICGGGNTFAAAVTFAESCASSVASLYVSSFSASATTGWAAACAQGCANGQAVAGTIASAVSEALVTAGACEQVTAYAQSSAFTAAFTAVTGAAWSKSCSFGPGNAASSASAQGFVQALATGYAQAFAGVVAATCGGSCNQCSCSIGTEYPQTSISAALATVSGGFYAVAAAWGDAGAQVCSHNGKPLNTLAAGVLTAWGTTCVDAMIQLNVNAYSKGNSFACAGVLTTAEANAISESASNMFASAFTYNFHRPSCTAFSAVDGSVFNQNFVDIFAGALLKACSAHGASTVTDAEVVAYIATDPTYSGAVANALSGIDSCICAGAPFCPSSCGCYAN